MFKRDVKKEVFESLQELGKKAKEKADSTRAHSGTMLNGIKGHMPELVRTSSSSRFPLSSWSFFLPCLFLGSRTICLDSGPHRVYINTYLFARVPVCPLGTTCSSLSSCAAASFFPSLLSLALCLRKLVHSRVLLLGRVFALTPLYPPGHATKVLLAWGKAGFSVRLRILCRRDCRSVRCAFLWDPA